MDEDLEVFGRSPCCRLTHGLVFPPHLIQLQLYESHANWSRQKKARKNTVYCADPTESHYIWNLARTLVRSPQRL